MFFTILDLIKHYTFFQHTDRQTNRQTETDRQRQTERDRDRQRHRHRERERHREGRGREREKDRQTGRQKDLCRLLGPMKILAYVGVY